MAFDYLRDIQNIPGQRYIKAGTFAPRQVKFGRAVGITGDSEKVSLDASASAAVAALDAEYGATVREIGSAVNEAADIISRMSSSDAEVAAGALFDATCRAASTVGLEDVCNTVTDAVMALVGWLIDLWPATASYPEPGVHNIVRQLLGYESNEKMFSDGWIVLWTADHGWGALPINTPYTNALYWLHDSSESISDAEWNSLREKEKRGSASDWSQIESSVRSKLPKTARRYVATVDPSRGPILFTGNAGGYGVSGYAYRLGMLPKEIRKAIALACAAPSEKRPRDPLILSAVKALTLKAPDPTVCYQAPALVWLVRDVATPTFSMLKPLVKPIGVSRPLSTPAKVAIGAGAAAGIWAAGKWLFKWW